jgi:hypothetical protein
MMTLTIDGKDTVEMSLKVGEKVNPKLTFESDGSSIDMSSAVLTVMLKTAKSEAASLTINDGDMDKTSEATGIIYFPLDTSTLSAQTYLMDVKVVFGVDSVEFSPDINLKIISPVTV